MDSVRKARCAPPKYTRSLTRGELPEKFLISMAAWYARVSDNTILNWNRKAGFAIQPAGSGTYIVDKEKFLAFLEGIPFEPYKSAIIAKEA